MRKHIEAERALTTAITGILATLVAALIQGCGTTLQLASKWSEHKIQVDGDLTKWSDSTLFAEKDGIRCGVMNDDEFLYLCLLSTTPNLGRQVVARGMTVWFDPNGGEKKTFGLRFPIGMTGMGRPGMPTRPEGEEAGQRGSRFEEIERQALTDFEFLGPTENDRQRVPRMQGQGVEIHLTATPERFVYELKIPLLYSSQHPYALETSPGSKIGVGIDSSTPERGIGGGGGPGSGGGPGGERPGVGGGRGGRMPASAGPGGARPGMTVNPFSLWIHVQLAEKAR